MEDERAFCPLCGDDLDEHRKTCRFEGTVHGSEVVYCRYTGGKTAICSCERCEYDRSIVKTCAAMLSKEPADAKSPADVPKPEVKQPEVGAKPLPVVTRVSLDLV